MDALSTACNIQNKIIIRVIPKSPYESWKGGKPSLDYLRVWGYVSYYRTHDPKRSKLGARAMKSLFIVYAQNNKDYRLLYDKSSVVVESRNEEFFKFPRDVENSNPIIAQSTSQENVRPSQII